MRPNPSAVFRLIGLRLAALVAATPARPSLGWLDTIPE